MPLTKHQNAKIRRRLSKMAQIISVRENSVRSDISKRKRIFAATHEVMSKAQKRCALMELFNLERRIKFVKIFTGHIQLLRSINLRVSMNQHNERSKKRIRQAILAIIWYGQRNGHGGLYSRKLSKTLMKITSRDTVRNLMRNPRKSCPTEYELLQNNISQEFFNNYKMKLYEELGIHKPDCQQKEPSRPLNESGPPLCQTSPLYAVNSQMQDVQVSPCRESKMIDYWQNGASPLDFREFPPMLAQNLNFKHIPNPPAYNPQPQYGQQRNSYNQPMQMDQNYQLDPMMMRKNNQDRLSYQPQLPIPKMRQEGPNNAPRIAPTA
ncbi:MAG: hypothetical protein MHMPM18_004397, partial [Marteilia pararefringens]